MIHYRVSRKAVAPWRNRTQALLQRCVRVLSINQRSHPPGFTLLEILLVLFLFSLAFTLSAFSVTSGLKKIRHKTEVKKISTIFTYARNLAVAKRRMYYTEFSTGKMLVAPVDSEGKRRVFFLSKGLRIKNSQGNVTLFYPGGSSSGGLFSILDRDGKIVSQLSVTPSTGKVHEFTAK